ncbi:hypothetical protein D3C80_1869790 [compost metagenome]
MPEAGRPSRAGFPGQVKRSRIGHTQPELTAFRGMDAQASLQAGEQLVDRQGRFQPYALLQVR